NLASGLINNPPELTAPFTDTSGQFTVYSDTVLVGDSVQFNLSLIDTNTVPGTLQNVYMDINSEVLLDSVLAPGANCALPPCANLSVPVPIGPTPFSLSTAIDWITDCSHLITKDSCMELSRQVDFEVIFNDDFCPIPGIGARVVSVIIKDLQPAASPTLDSMNILPNGDVELFWDTPTDPNGVFTTFYIYYANDSAGPYTVIDSITNFNQTTYTHIGAMGNMLLGYYQMASKSSILCQTNYEAPSANRISNFQIFTGIENQGLEYPISIFPNPAKQTLNISSTLFTEEQVEIEITNLLGQVIERLNASNSTNQVLDISAYKSGMHNLSLFVDDKLIGNKKFVKQ
ncbi:MAG: T9SS type A sorting domain-containing protein, partial [Bacteroidia bacterium]|nr:T9SS type A sorting domain-containing protein [Bacteroidia bacterium]